jgi:EPS-associated MarR family transcriptional regulator
MFPPSEDRDAETYMRVLRVLYMQPQLNQRALAARVGVSLGKVNFCLQALAEKGWIKMQNFVSSPAKLRYSYVLTPSGLSHKTELTRLFLRRKVAEFEMLKSEIAQLEDEVGIEGLRRPSGSSSR